MLLGSCGPAPMSTVRRGGDREREEEALRMGQARDEDAGRASRQGHRDAGEREARARIGEGDEMVAGARAPLVAQGLGKGITRERATMVDGDAARGEYGEGIVTLGVYALSRYIWYSREDKQ
jgi:hypothetical protein